MGYRVFITQKENEKDLGTGIVCYDFPSLQKAILYGESKLLFPESYFDVRLYYSDRNIVGGINDNGEFVGRYYKKDFEEKSMKNTEKIFDDLGNLEVELNRMYTTDNVQELEQLKEVAQKRVEQIFQMKLEQLMQENAEKLDNLYPITEENPNAQYRPPRKER